MYYIVILIYLRVKLKFFKIIFFNTWLKIDSLPFCMQKKAIIVKMTIKHDKNVL